MTSKAAVIASIALLTALPASAGRIISTPFAETPKDGAFRFSVTTLKEEQSTDLSRLSYRLDLGLTGSTELGIYVSAPENRPTTTQFNVQQRLMDETTSRPTVSVGVWDIGHIDKFSGQKSGGSFYVAVSKALKVSDSRPPLKLGIGLGTNKLDGLFGGVIAPLAPKLGLMAEYVPENLRLSGADPINAGVYYYINPNTRLRATLSGGNPGFDINISGTFR